MGQCLGHHHELTDVQVKRIKEDIKEAKLKGVKPLRCENCHRKKEYQYWSGERRGGTRTSYICGNCYNRRHTTHYDDPDDYDFLAR